MHVGEDPRYVTLERFPKKRAHIEREIVRRAARRAHDCDRRFSVWIAQTDRVADRSAQRRRQNFGQNDLSFATRFNDRAADEVRARTCGGRRHCQEIAKLQRSTCHVVPLVRDPHHAALACDIADRVRRTKERANRRFELERFFARATTHRCFDDGPEKRAIDRREFRFASTQGPQFARATVVTSECEQRADELRATEVGDAIPLRDKRDGRRVDHRLTPPER